MVDVSRAIGISRVDNRLRIVLPKIIREELGLKTGDYVVFYVGDNGEICIAKARYPERVKAVLI